MKNVNSNKSNKKQPLDKFVKGQINLLDFTPIPSKNWTKSQSWEIIKQNIKSTEHKVIVWGMALAATISIAVAASIQLNLIDFIDFSSHKDTVVYVEKIQPKNEEINFDQEQQNQLTYISTLSSKDIIYAEPKLVMMVEIPNKNNTHSNYDVKSNFSIPKIEPYFSLGFQQNVFKPEVGVDFLIYSIQNKFKKQNVKLGLSSEFIQAKQETKNELNIFHFANLSFEKLNLRTNKGWALKTGVLLNNMDSNFYSGTTMKLGFKRHFNKWLKAGPELIFTNDWKNIYPSITISFG